MKPLTFGAGIIFVVGVIAFILQDWSLFPKLSGSIGLLLLLLSAAFSNSLGSGDRIRANFATEDEEERQSRNKLWHVLFITGCTNVIVAIIAFIWL